MSRSLFKNNEQFWSKLIVIVSVLVPVLVTVLFNIPQVEISLPFDPKILPSFHALLNGTVSLLLVASFYFIKQKNIAAHKACNISALVLSALFLVSYVTYHTVSESTPYGGEGFIRYVYFFILITHIILAAIILPVILFTFLRAFTGNFESHRAIAKYTFPLWLYVSVTGVLVYLMLLPYY